MVDLVEGSFFQSYVKKTNSMNRVTDLMKQHSVNTQTISGACSRLARPTHDQLLATICKYLKTMRE